MKYMGFDNSLATFCTLMTSTRTITFISSPTSQSSGGPLASADSTGQERPETLGGIDMNGYKANIAAVLSSSGRTLASAERRAGSTGRHRNPPRPCPSTPDGLSKTVQEAVAASHMKNTTCKSGKSPETYSHSFTLVCRGDNPVDSSLVVGFSRLAAESRRVSSRGHLGQNVG